MIADKIALFNYENGAFIMTVIFAIVIIGLVAGVYLMMKNDEKKSEK